MKNALPYIVIIVIAAAIGWYFGQHNHPDTPDTEEPTQNTAAHDHSHGDHSHSHDGHSHDHPHTPAKSSDDRTEKNQGTEVTMGKIMAQAYQQSQKIREENETILAELLTTDEVRAMYHKRLEDADLSLYDDDGNRLSEDEYVEKWIKDHGIETKEMVAAMEAEAQRPIENVLNRAQRAQNPPPKEMPEVETPEQKEAAIRKQREIRRAEAETIRNELLTRNQIEQLYEQKLSEGNPEVILPDGSVVPKNTYVTNFIDTYGELTPELEKTLNEIIEAE